jgi:outer membrane lipoprotein-sorting protein
MPMHPPSPRRPDRRAALGRLAAAAVALGGAARAGAQPAFDLAQLMQMLAQVRSGQATFTERRSVAILERTLESSGRVSFEAPDTFVRETLKPRRERLAIVGNTLTMSLGERSRTLTLDSVPEASLLMEAIRATLTGNRETLERSFDASVSGDARQWALQLVPREPRLRELVVSVRLAGRQSTVREVTVAMADGDRSVMTLEPMVPGTGSAAAPARSASTPG